VADQPRFPTWVECKYDGIRMILHKTTDSTGRLLVAAFTRKRHDWSELLPGLRPLLQAVPAGSVILDGELHGYMLAASGVPRPATVYEVHQMLRGELPAGGVVQLRFVAFDLLYLDGHDWTKVPFMQRRLKLEQLLTWPSSQTLPLPIQLSQGGRVENKEQLQRFYEQFRRQGHEGLMVKEELSPYPLAQRSPHWLKKKPEETLDLVLTAAYWGQSTSPGQRMFDTYSIACRSQREGTPHWGWVEVGKVAGVDAATTQHIAQEIWRCQLLTGETVESRGHDRVQSGVRLAPQLVVSVRYEGILRDVQTGEISLRSPRIVALRSGEMPVQETATQREMETLALRHQIS
jgi:DNA ligase-1